MVFDILGYEFMQRALLGGFLIGVSSSLIGVFLVLKRLSLLGDSFAHASFGGIALGFVLKINPLITAILFVGIASLGIDKLVNKMKMYGDSAIALFLSFGMAFAIILIGYANKMNNNIFSYLFGSILTISLVDIYIMFFVLILILVFYYFNYKNLLYSTFNNEMAIVRNKKIKWVDKIFIILAAITIVVSIRAVGILLISAILVIPTLIALRLSNSFKSTLIIASISSVLGIYIGIFLAYFFDLPTGGVIVMSQIGLFVLSLFYKK